jgi:hypothetical protein
MSDNPILEDMEFKPPTQLPLEERKDPMMALAQAVETILSDKNIEQKTKISSANEIGLIQCESVIKFIRQIFPEDFDIETDVLVELCRQKRLNAVSVGGWRADQIVKIFESVKSEFVTADIPIGRKFFGQGK